MPIERVTAKLGLPFGLGEIGGEWAPEQRERDAAWEMYVELITRIGVAELGDDEGLIREAFSSLHSLFEITRDILRRYGPTVARPGPNSTVSFGHLAVAVLNSGLRPLLAKWHPVLEDHERRRPDGVGRKEWESRWEHHDEAREAIEDVRKLIRAYAGLLGEVCGAKDLLRLT